MQIVKCVMVSLWLLVSIIALSLFFGDQLVLRKKSIKNYVDYILDYMLCSVYGDWNSVVDVRG